MRARPQLVGGGKCVFVALHPAVLNASGSLRLATSGGLFPSLTRRHKGAPICQHVRTTHRQKKQKNKWEARREGAPIGTARESESEIVWRGYFVLGWGSWGKLKDRVRVGQVCWRVCHHLCIPTGALPLALQLKREAKEWEEPTGRNGDADGHTLHLGPSPKVNKCSGSHLVKTGGKGVRECRRGWEGQWVEERVATSASIWKSRFFLSLQQSGEGKCQHALRPRLTVPRSAPPPGPPCSATEYWQQWHCATSPQGGHWGRWRGWGEGAGEYCRARDHPHARVYTNTSWTPCYFSHKRRTKKRWPCLLW